jgi:hypothetical protein
MLVVNGIWPFENTILVTEIQAMLTLHLPKALQLGHYLSKIGKRGQGDAYRLHIVLLLC